MRSKWKNFVLSWKIQKKINAANEVLTSQRIKLKQLHLNSLDLLQKKQEFSFLETANFSFSTLPTMHSNSSFFVTNNPPLSNLSEFKKKEIEKMGEEPLVASSSLLEGTSIETFSLSRKGLDKVGVSKSSFFKSKKSYFFFKKISKIENKKLKKSFLQKSKISDHFYDSNARWTSYKDIIVENDSDFQNIIDVEQYTGILSNRPIILKQNSFNIPVDALDIVFNIMSYTTSRFLLIKQFMTGHKFGEFLFTRKLGKKKTKKKSKK